MEPRKSRQCCCGLSHLGQECFLSDIDDHFGAGTGSGAERNRTVLSFCFKNDSLNLVMD